MPWRLLFGPVGNLAEGLVDAFRDSVLPESGSVLYCDLAFGYAEHSGIYVGHNEIVHLSSEGVIELTTPERFKVPGTALTIYVSCQDTYSVGSKSVSKRARSMVGNKRSYNLVFDNCHQFSAGCLTGDFENSINFLWMLKDESSKKLGSNTWRAWTTDDGKIVRAT